MNGGFGMATELGWVVRHPTNLSCQSPTIVATISGSYRRRTSLAAATANDAGFTLIEVIVALAILAAGLSVMLSMISDGLLRTSTAEKMVAAGSLTQSLMAEVGTVYPIRADEQAGEFPDGYRWQLKIQPYARGNDGTPVQLYEVSANVQWDEGGQTRSFLLKTLRTGPRVSQR